MHVGIHKITYFAENTGQEGQDSKQTRFDISNFKTLKNFHGSLIFIKPNSEVQSSSIHAQDYEVHTMSPLK